MNFPEIGEVFRGRYKIIDVVGAGGFSRVYHAEQIDLGRPVAIKILKPTGDDDKGEEERRRKFESISKRFEREAKLISKLRDPHTVVMHDYGRTTAGLFYMVLEYVDGLTIGELIQRDGALVGPRVVKILQQALSSLHEAHAFGILHRDIKPGNIMVYDHVGRSDNVKVLDFGIAKSIDEATSSKDSAANSSELTAEGILIGTPRYMSPEQIRGTDLGAATDIYSLGLVAYEMLMGVKAIPADSSIKIISRHLDTDPIELPSSPGIPKALRSIVNRMLAKNVDERFASCRDVLQQLDEWSSDRSFDWAIDSYSEVEDLDVSFFEELDSPKKSNAVLLAAVAIVLLTAVAVGANFLSSSAAQGSQRSDEIAAPVAGNDTLERDTDWDAIAAKLKPPENNPKVLADIATPKVETEVETAVDVPSEEPVKIAEKEKKPKQKKRKKRRSKKKRKSTKEKTTEKVEAEVEKIEEKKESGFHIVPLGGK